MTAARMWLTHNITLKGTPGKVTYTLSLVDDYILQTSTKWVGKVQVMSLKTSAYIFITFLAGIGKRPWQ